MKIERNVSVAIIKRDGKFYVRIDGLAPEPKIFGPAPSEAEARAYVSGLCDSLASDERCKVFVVLDAQGPQA
jgi:hypothetical protein